MSADGNRADSFRSGLDLAREAFALAPGDDKGFEQLERRVAAFQREHNPFYDRFCQAAPEGGMWLPVEAFGLANVATFNTTEAEALFLSSGTSSTARSRHFVRSLDVYHESVVRAFNSVVGSDRITFLAHLPGYADAGASEIDGAPARSSLVQMAHAIMQANADAADSGFFLDDVTPLLEALSVTPTSRPRVVLLGAAFGLLDLAESDLTASFGPDDLIIETGGMKTHRREISRDELHSRIASGFSVSRAQVWSEYGMCELFSQFYLAGAGQFVGPPWARVVVLDPDDPTQILPSGEVGRIAVIDLANVFTASRLLTSDRGMMTADGFQVLGRLSGAALRGCNFLVETALQASR